MNLKGCSISELKKIFAEMEEPPYRAEQAFRRINKHLISNTDEFTEFSKSLRQTLSEEDALPRLLIRTSQTSSDGTEKCLFVPEDIKRARDEKFMESVWIPSGKRNTICVSSQYGCSLNCEFCATGRLKFGGNIPTWQILDQIYEFIRHRKGEKPSNIVFMGMGEPFFNYDSVLTAAHILNHPDGLNISAQKITISTAGMIEGIERFTREKEPFHLAISLNHPDSEKRSKMMAINRKNPLNKLLEVARRYTKSSNKEITFEYVMIPGYNMSEEDAKKLIKIVRSVNCKLNLIPLNTQLEGFRTPTDDEIVDFSEFLYNADIKFFNRGSPGKDINAACGMLALKNR